MEKWFETDKRYNLQELLFVSLRVGWDKIRKKYTGKTTSSLRYQAWGR